MHLPRSLLVPAVATGLTLAWGLELMPRFGGGETDEVNKAFNYNPMGSLWRSLDTMGDTMLGSMQELSSNVHVKQNQDEYAVAVDVPGFTRKEIEVNLSPADDFIHISANKSCSDADNLHCFNRELHSDLRVPPSADTEHMHVALEDGVLYVHFPKKADGSAAKGRFSQFGESIQNAYTRAKEHFSGSADYAKHKADETVGEAKARIIPIAEDAGSKASEYASRAGSKASEYASDAAAKAGEYASEAGSKASEYASDAAAKAGEYASDAAAKAKDYASDAGEYATEKAREYAQGAGEYVADAGSKAGEYAADAGKKAWEYAGNPSELAADARQKAREYAGSAGEYAADARDKAGEYADSASDYVADARKKANEYYEAARESADKHGYEMPSAEDVVANVKDYVEQARQKVQEYAESAGYSSDKAKQYAQDAANKAQEYAQSASDAAKGYAQSAKGKAEKAVEEGEEYREKDEMRGRPWKIDRSYYGDDVNTQVEDVQPYIDENGNQPGHIEDLGAQRKEKGTIERAKEKIAGAYEAFREKLDL